MRHSFIRSVEPIKDGAVSVVFDQSFDSFTLRITANLDSDAVDRLSFIMRGPYLLPWDEPKFFKCLTPNKLIAGYMLDTSLVSDSFPTLLFPSPLGCRVWEITPTLGDGCAVRVTDPVYRKLQSIEIPDITSKRILELFGKSSYDDLNSYLRNSEIPAKVWKDHLYLPVPLPAISITAKVL